MIIKDMFERILDINDKFRSLYEGGEVKINSTTSICLRDNRIELRNRNGKTFMEIYPDGEAYYAPGLWYYVYYSTQQTPYKYFTVVEEREITLPSYSYPITVYRMKAKRELKRGVLASAYAGRGERIEEILERKGALVW